MHSHRLDIYIYACISTINLGQRPEQECGGSYSRGLGSLSSRDVSTPAFVSLSSAVHEFIGWAALVLVDRNRAFNGVVGNIGKLKDACALEV